MLSDSTKLLVAGFLMGWGPCLAYTAPLLLPYIGATKRTWQDGLKIGLAFSTGRLLAFAILGGIVTVAFSYINKFFPPHRFGLLYLIVSIFMLVIGIFIILGKAIRIPIGKKIIGKGIENMFVIGFLMGIAPCAPYIAILTYIACIAENKVIAGIIYAVLFAIGTAIAPIALGGVVGMFSEKLLKSEKLFRSFQIICGTILILFGLHLIYSVLNQIV